MNSNYYNRIVLEFLNNRILRMFLVRDFSKENLKKETPSYQTLRACTSQKKFNVCPPQNEYVRVGSYKFREQDMLGKGFSSKVYKAVHINNVDERYAIKVINLKKFKASNLAMLESEIEVHRTLTHPNIVQFYDAYKTENYYYIITEYCPHGDLMQLLNQKKKIQENRALNIIQQIIQGYNYLAKKNILHRDMKPANIFRNGETWKIGDFGFAMICKTQSFFDKINVGTPLYMPPQALKSNKYSFKSDIFAIGIILYEMLTGRTPWECKTQKQLILKMKTQLIKYPQFKNQQLRKFITKACDVNQIQRLSIKQLPTFFSQTTNPQQKQNDRKLLRNALSLKTIRDSSKYLSSGQISKNTTQTTLSTQTNIATHKKMPTINLESSTQVSEESDSNRIKNTQTYRQKNTRLILQQLQFCRLIYYMTKNIKYFQIDEPKNKSFLCLTLFKHLLKCIKQLQQPNINFANQLISFEIYSSEKQYKNLYEQIKNYSKRYQKQYLDILKNTQISVIRAVNRKFPQLSYNSPLGEQFYSSYSQYFIETLRLVNHGVSSDQYNQTDQSMIAAGYQAVDSLYAYCAGIQQKLTSCEIKKTSCFANFSQKVVMDYRNSKLENKDYISLRQKLKTF